MENKYDVIIVGAGPAGLSAAVYTGRANLKTLVIEREDFGSLLMAHKIENYIGYAQKGTGKELYNIMKSQVLGFGVEFVSAKFLELDATQDIKKVSTTAKNFYADAIIIAMGTAKSSDNKIEGEEEFLGRGVSYCATCDGAFYKNMTTSVFGNGEEAIQETIDLTQHSNEVMLFVEEDELLVDEKIQKEVEDNSRIKVYYSKKIQKIDGGDFVEKVIIKDTKSGEIEEYTTTAAFLFLGTKSKADMFMMFAEMDEKGHIITNEKMETLIPGVYAAGDIREKELRQVATAVSDGAIAGVEATRFILKNKKANS